jgi:hypothetical protein
MGIRGGQPFFKLQRLQKMVSPPLEIYQGATDSSFAHGVQKSVLIRYCYKTMQAAVTLNNENVNVRNIGQGEAQHRKYKRLKRLKLGGGQMSTESGHILGQYMTSKHNLL